MWLQPKWARDFTEKKSKEFYELQEVKEVHIRAEALAKEVKALNDLLEERKEAFFRDVVKPELERLEKERAEQEDSSDDEDDEMRGLRALFRAGIALGECTEK